MAALRDEIVRLVGNVMARWCVDAEASTVRDASPPIGFYILTSSAGRQRINQIHHRAPVGRDPPLVVA
jgi:hypothetical protein